MLRMNGFFPLCYGFFTVCNGLHRAVVWVIHGVTCRLPVYQRNFSCLLRISSCHSLWEFVHQSSMFRVVDVLCAVSYTAAKYECIFSLYCGFSSLPLCLSVKLFEWSVVLAADSACIGGFFPVCCGFFSCHSLLVICASVQYI